MGATGWSKVAGVVAITLWLSGVSAAEPPKSVWAWATGPSVYDEEGKRDWTVDVTPYLWVASLDGDIGLPGIGPAQVSTTFNNLSDGIEAGFMGFLDARWRRWHLISDNSWIKYTDKVSLPFPIQSQAKIEAEVAFGTVGVAYELPIDLGFAWDVYVAARWWHLDSEAKFDPALLPGGPFRASKTRDWADVVGGMRIRYQITERWRLTALGDGGGGTSDVTWKLYAGGGYDWNRHIGVTAGYRILGVDYEDRGVVYDVRQHGLVLGVRLGF